MIKVGVNQAFAFLAGILFVYWLNPTSQRAGWGAFIIGYLAIAVVVGFIQFLIAKLSSSNKRTSNQQK